MNNYVLLALCFGLGIILRKLKRLPENAAATLNGFVIHISLPALTLTYVHGLSLQTDLIVPALMAWVMFAVGYLAFWFAGRAFGLSPTTTGALTLTAGMANTSFVGLPMIDTFYGPHYLGLGILIDQVGSYFVLSTLGILTAATYASNGIAVCARTILRKIILFVPFQAFVLALLLIPFEYPSWLDELLKRLGATLVPLALVSVGYQLQLSQTRGKAAALSVGLAFKLVIAPAVILLLFAGLMRNNWEVLSVTVFEAAMGPMIGASIVAMDYGLDPPLVTLMVGVGIPISFLTLPVWWHVLNMI